MRGRKIHGYEIYFGLRRRYLELITYDKLWRTGILVPHRAGRRANPALAG